MDLRIGKVLARDLYEARASLSVEEIPYGENEKAFLFLGDGFSLADRWIKERSNVSDLQSSYEGSSVLPRSNPPYIFTLDANQEAPHEVVIDEFKINMDESHNTKGELKKALGKQQRDESSEIDLSGLSCRLKPFKAQNGSVYSASRKIKQLFQV